MTSTLNAKTALNDIVLHNEEPTTEAMAEELPTVNEDVDA